MINHYLNPLSEKTFIRFVLCLFISVLFTEDLHAQSSLFTPIKLSKIDLVNHITNDGNTLIHSKRIGLSHCSIYKKNDSTFIGYKDHQLNLNYFIQSTISFTNNEIDEIQTIEEIDQPILLLIKSSKNNSRSGSAWTFWSENASFWTIIDLKNHQVIFDFQIEKNYYEEHYLYEGDFTDESLSETEVNNIIDNREVEVVESYNSGFQITIDGSILEIKNKSKTIENVDCCNSRLKEGIYHYFNGKYVKK